FDKPTARQVAQADTAKPVTPKAQLTNVVAAEYPSSPWAAPQNSAAKAQASATNVQFAGAVAPSKSNDQDAALSSGPTSAGSRVSVKTLLAAIGLASITLRAIKSVR